MLSIESNTIPVIGYTLYLIWYQEYELNIPSKTSLFFVLIKMLLIDIGMSRSRNAKIIICLPQRKYGCSSSKCDLIC